MQKIELLGTNVSFIDVGVGTPIIFLHGWGKSFKSFEYFRNNLEKEYRVIMIDLPGFGNSDEPTEVWGIPEYEKLLHEFIKEKNLINYHIVAHSFGARIALLHAASKNDNIQKMILTGAAGIKPSRDFVYYLAISKYKMLKFLAKTKIYHQYLEAVVGAGGSEDYKNASPLMKQVLIKTVNYDLSSILNSIDVPVLLYWGENDNATPLKDGIKMNKKITNSQLIVRKRETHFSFLESKENFLYEIKKFITYKEEK